MLKIGPPSPKHVMYLAVLPKYRSACIDELIRLIPDIELYVSEEHLDRTVKTGIRRDQYHPVRMHRIAGHAFLQTGYFWRAARASSLVVDLNPRSITAWAFLAIRKISRRRTIVWGHIHPQAGPTSKTARLRKYMRSLADGTISYTYRDAQFALNQISNSPVWIAPNSLYRAKDIFPAASDASRSYVLYVGRLEAAKKVHLLIAALEYIHDLRIRVLIVGSGSQRATLEERAERLGVRDRVEFVGWVDSTERLRELYREAFASASPGFAGLGLTQSAGFGVPMIVAHSEPHSPEIELSEVGAVQWFDSDDPISLAHAIQSAYDRRGAVPDIGLSDTVRSRYSAEKMARGLAAAIRNEGDGESHGEQHGGA